MVTPMVVYIINGRPTTIPTIRQGYEERSRRPDRDNGPLFELPDSPRSVPGREGTPADVAMALAMVGTLERLIATDPREREQ